MSEKLLKQFATVKGKHQITLTQKDANWFRISYLTDGRERGAGHAETYDAALADIAATIFNAARIDGINYKEVPING